MARLGQHQSQPEVLIGRDREPFIEPANALQQAAQALTLGGFVGEPFVGGGRRRR
jgi:hypothetical protein